MSYCSEIGTINIANLNLQFYNSEIYNLGKYKLNNIQNMNHKLIYGRYSAFFKSIFLNFKRVLFEHTAVRIKQLMFMS